MLAKLASIETCCAPDGGTVPVGPSRLAGRVGRSGSVRTNAKAQAKPHLPQVRTPPRKKDIYNGSEIGYDGANQARLNRPKFCKRRDHDRGLKGKAAESLKVRVEGSNNLTFQRGRT